MVLAQVSVCFHAQRAAVFMSKPARDSGNVHTALDADRREEMAEVVMRNTFHPDLRRRVRHAVLAFGNMHHGCVRRFIRSFRSQFGQQPLKLGNHWHKACFSVLCGSFRISSHVQLVAREIHVRPSDVLCFANPQSAVRKEAHKVPTILRLSGTGGADRVHKFQELFARRRLQLFLANLHARKSRGGIVEPRAGADRFVENSSQRADAIVDDAWRVPLLISAKPKFAIARRYLAHVGLEKRRPRTANEVDHQLAIIF